MADETKADQLRESTDMAEPIAGTVELDIPASELWSFFTKANVWPRWNKCFFHAVNNDLVEGEQLIWTFEPIKRWLLYKMFAIAKIIEVVPDQRVTWEVSALPGFFAHHTYHVKDLGDGRSEFGSWEKAMGWGFRLTKWFWTTHFVFVKDESLKGARTLEQAYRDHGRLDPDDLPRRRYWTFWVGLLAMLLMVTAVGLGGWFYVSFVRQTVVDLEPGVHAVYGGGSNALILSDGRATVAIDPKFPPGSATLAKWIDGNAADATVLVNTHYHYDHTLGNAIYDGAEIYAHARASDLMLNEDNDYNDPLWWQAHRTALPDRVVTDSVRLRGGGRTLVLYAAPVAHTHADLWVHLPGANVVVTGDIFSNGYFPFFDLSEGGTSIPGLIGVLRHWSGRFPDATFVPGHGPVATSEEVGDFADYLESLWTFVQGAHTEGLSEDETVDQIDLSPWDLKILPSFYKGQLLWATEKNNVRWAYRLADN